MPCSNPASTDESFGNLQDIFRGGDVLGYSGNMSVSNLSASTQDYLKAVWVLGEWSDEPVTQKRISERLGLKLSSVSDAVRRLTDQGLLDHTPRGAVTLTESGQSYAVEMVRRHRLIETFLVATLGYRWDQVHDEAEMIEHAVSDFMIERIAEHLGYPDQDPHGDLIPSADGTAHRSEAVLLTELEQGRPARVVRISDEDPALLQFFAERGIGVSVVVEVQEGAPYSDSLRVRIDGSNQIMPLGRSATDAVRVEPLD